ncbi:MAG: HIT domain-containing protein [Methylococcaceae bacterium]|nr:HIT domain-containing protein [Methylococcaceae bacterium]
MTFQLHPRLQQDCIVVGNFALCRLLMMNDSQYPWFILVPQKSEITEIYQLEISDRQLLIEESSHLAEILVDVYKPDKLNIATIGNLVPQLHIHHVVRYQNDKAWPKPVWGKYAAVQYTEKQIYENLTALNERLMGYLSVC